MTWSEFFQQMGPVINPILGVVGMLLAAWLTMLGQRAITAFQDRTKIQLSDQQRAALQASFTTAAGQINTLLDRGIISISQVRENSPIVTEKVQQALARVPEAAAGQAVTAQAAAEIVVGRVDTASRPTPGTVTTTTVETPSKGPIP